MLNTKKDIEKLTIDIDEKFKIIAKETKETKDYVSTISLGHTYKR
jgi:hypothetical protein